MKFFCTYSLLFYAITGVPLAIWMILSLNKYDKIPRKQSILYFLSFLWFVPCIIEGQRIENEFFHMNLGGKIVSIRNVAYTSVLVEGYDDYILLDCLTDDLSVGDSLYKPPDSKNQYRLFKQDSTGEFKEIELYRDGRPYHKCSWRWMDSKK